MNEAQHSKNTDHAICIRQLHFVRKLRGQGLELQHMEKKCLPVYLRKIGDILKTRHHNQTIHFFLKV